MICGWLSPFMVIGMVIDAVMAILVIVACTVFIIKMARMK